MSDGKQDQRPEWEIARERVLKLHPKAEVGLCAGEYVVVTDEGIIGFGSNECEAWIDVQNWEKPL